ncbi:hypothetical protein F5Y12DRAFT_715952 [Xylaria sp. FL1777]|nr:hypothetical protein F5Y12DRAFT_715952 [Xylaria sp. FL1777]
MQEGQIRFVDTEEEGVQGRYMTLSHRWGNSILKVYQGTIRIMRELQIDYIYINSLCIVQNDLGDWERESIRMKTIYENSYLNVAAYHARSTHGDLFSSSNLTNRFPTHSDGFKYSNSFPSRRVFSQYGSEASYLSQSQRPASRVRFGGIEDAKQKPRASSADGRTRRDSSDGGIAPASATEIDDGDVTLMSVRPADMGRDVVRLDAGAAKAFKKLAEATIPELEVRQPAKLFHSERRPKR